MNTIDDILGKISFVIRFMALFSILTGTLVLIGSVILSKFQRIRESVILRTIGASKRQILSINFLEYFLLGSLSAISGILIALVSSTLLSLFSFDVSFRPQLTPVLLIYLFITSTTIVIGLANSRGITSQPPLKVLREEIQ